MLYDFRCDDCGQVREIALHSSEIMGHSEVCNCGDTMRRIYYPVAATGDLPGKGNIGYYDPVLGKQIVSGRQRRDWMEQQGLTEYSPTAEEVKIEAEASYVGRHAKKSEIRKAVNNIARASFEERRTKRIKEAVNKSVDEATRGVSA